jgi:type IV pilus assembly protein PilB
MNPSNYTLATELKQLISPEQAHHYQIVPSEMHSDAIVFRTSAENHDHLALELQIILGKKTVFIPCKTQEIEKYLAVNYRKKKQEQLHYNDDFLSQVIHEAKDTGSSDIHFEIFEKKARVRFRIDGKLIERYLIELQEYPVLVNRIKIMAQLDISEKRLPQDGRIQMQTTTNEFDIRVSILPTLHGEKIVLRLLSKDSTNLHLENLGFSDMELQRYKENIQKPNGIVLISGPTGSGKTTTLYATLKQLNKVHTNILTIEDPIEYTLKGINQVQLKESIGLDYTSTLKTFLRQDPDIIMLGEIRDSATANMAIRAALTGHLVFSTIHTNSAWATIARLTDMGVAPFLIASTLHMSVAQRLVRKLCPHCKKKTKTTPALLAKINSFPPNITSHYQAVGCEHCFHTGYAGRKAIYEIIPITAELTEMIQKNALEIDKYLTSNGIHTLRSNALQLLRKGITSLEEIYPLLTP